ncbi:hypothetical protein DVH24_038046 [Malus domestica]|uniref:Rx N-terminal domain-containing protein n=1 Tax=Malus domestica TaxID=3750 RepID=A0A498KE16_MALDO|nr:hypothetical protein DVH24_038046 [Malus domestica]
MQETMGGEAFLVAFLQVLVDKLAQREVFKYFGLVKGVDQKLKKWSATLSAIGVVLNAAEERQLMVENNALKLWLDDLRDLAFDVEDLLDKYATKMLNRQTQHADSSTTSKSPFRDGEQGSKIIVTTHDTDVSKMMGAATLVHNLEPMESNVCLQVFEQHAFLNSNEDKPPNYELLKEKIVAKCRGLSLAARTLGGVLLHKDTYEWEDILNNKLWSLSNEHGILPVLRLTYFYLPSHLKNALPIAQYFQMTMNLKRSK